MALYEQGIATPFNSLGVIPTEVFGIAINWFPNRTPFMSRAPKAPVSSLDFKITNDNFRPRSTTMNDAGGISNSDTSMIVTDGSIFQAGDVIQIESEYILITAVSTNTLTIVRAQAGTSAASHADALTIYLIGNSRTGGEVSQTGINRLPVTVTQNLQTFQFPYEIGGSLESASPGYALAPGVPSVVGRARMMAMQHCSDDFESTSYYGKGVAIAAATTRPAQKGIKTLLTTNNTTSPANAAAYKPSDLVRDTLQKCYDGGGNPSTLYVSTDFMTGLSTWGHALTRIPAGETRLGVKIDTFEAPFLAGIEIIPAPLLRAGTAICLSAGESRMRVKRAMFDKPRGSVGDATQGDVIMEAAIEIDNEAHHAWVEGITAFSAT